MTQPYPVGAIVPWVGTDAPEGWLECDGSTYGTGAQPDLFDVIGHTYGGSGGSFNVPDLRGRHALGKPGALSLGDSGGALDHTHAGTDHIHGFVQPSGHSAHSVTQPGGHSAHAVTQPAAHGTHASEGAHQHDTHGTTNLATTTPRTNRWNKADQHTSAGGHAHDAHSAHAGMAVDAHAAHAGADLDAHAAHANGAVQSGGTAATGATNAPYLVFTYIIRSAP